MYDLRYDTVIICLRGLQCTDYFRYDIVGRRRIFVDVDYDAV